MHTYKRHRFPLDIIAYAVWLYHRFNLGHRDVEDLLAETALQHGHDRRTPACASDYFRTVEAVIDSGSIGKLILARMSRREFNEVECRQNAYDGLALYHDNVMHMFIEHLLTRIRNRSCWLYGNHLWAGD